MSETWKTNSALCSTPGLHKLASLAADATQEADDLGGGGRGERQVCDALHAAQERALRAHSQRAAVGEPERATSRKQTGVWGLSGMRRQDKP